MDAKNKPRHSPVRFLSPKDFPKAPPLTDPLELKRFQAAAKLRHQVKARKGNLFLATMYGKSRKRELTEDEADDVLAVFKRLGNK